MHIGKLLLFLPAVIILASCAKERPLAGKLNIETDQEWGRKVYLIDPQTFDNIATSYTGRVLDSADVGTSGSFAFSKMPGAQHPVLLEIAIQKKTESYANALENADPSISNYFPIVWKDGERIEVAADADNFQQSFSIEDPSPENAAMLHLRDLRVAGYNAFLIASDSTAEDESVLLEHEYAVREFQKPLMDFAEQTPYLLPALTAIRWASVDGDYERIPEFLYTQCEKWQAVSPDDQLVAQLCVHAQREVLPVLIGDSIPDFPLPMLSGDTLALRELLGKRLTLLDLWASWCAPCRQENRQYLVPLWDTYHADGFQIIGYALDAGRNAWSNAVEKDGISRWPNASHLRGDDAPLFKALRIQTIPANFLINAEGKVVAKNLHGKELASYLSEAMQK